MPVEGTLPPARQTPRRGFPRLSLAAGATALVLSAACSSGAKDYVVQSKTAPDTHHVAQVRLVACASGFCESLSIGPTPDSLQSVATMPKERCTEIVWSPDSKRAGFVIDGQQLRLYDVESHRPAGQVDLVPRDGDPPTRLARGITFSENGAAITFDDCPREKSGCQPRILGLR